MSLITVNHLSKSFDIYKKTPGIIGSLTSLFNRSYEKKYAIKDISFSIKEGELVGFIGPNGAGKTTTMKVLSGLLYPSSGSVEVLGGNPFDRKHAFLKQIGFIMGQKNQLWWDLPAIESFLLHKEIYEIPQAEFDPWLDELTTLLNIKDILQVQVRNLSLGQRMKCEIAAQLLHKPKVLFLDEPTIGLDIVAQHDLREFIKGYNAKYKATILLTSHYMRDVQDLCDRVIIIDHGSLLFDGPLQKLMKKHAGDKKIMLTFSKPISKEALEKVGEVLSYEKTKATLSVSRRDTTSKAITLLQDLPIDDIAIEEIDIEQVIREYFVLNA